MLDTLLSDVIYFSPEEKRSDFGGFIPTTEGYPKSGQKQLTAGFSKSAVPAKGGKRPCQVGHPNAIGYTKGIWGVGASVLRPTL